MVTLNDIAARLGISKSTVSKGLNNASDVSEELRRKILETAAEMGYTFNVGPECEFFLFELDQDGRPTTKTGDEAGYFDLGPIDHGDHTRREICLALEKLGFEIDVHPVASGAINGLWHKGGVEFIGIGNFLHRLLEGDDIVRSVEGVGIFEVDLMLAGGALMVGSLNLKAQLFQG